MCQQSEEEKEENEGDSNVQDMFEEANDDTIVCKVCMKHLRDMPQGLRGHFKGSYGTFLKPNSLNSKTNKERSRRLCEHVRGELHAWCASQEKDEMKKEEIFNEKNIKSAEILVTSAIQSLLELDGSLQFVRLNNMLQTLFENEFPIKNDGRENFFVIRDLVFVKLNDKIKEKFQSLDKVTVRLTPFTVLMTYFFFEGRIHAFLNSVHKMMESEYDGPGCAEMVGNLLMSSLGLTKDEVLQKFRHGTYDGVYASNEERVAGGGSLSLMKHFANWCGNPKEFFTGHWDVAHRLQLVYGDVFKENPELKRFLKIVDQAKSYCQGKDGLVFQELAYKLKASYLTDKSEQTRRWVRSLLRLIEAYFRNLPTIYKMLGKLIEAARAGDLTEQKTLQQVIDSICDPYYICFGIGVAQILDDYAKVSLDAQKLWNFPGNLVLSLEKLKCNLVTLENDFHWSEEKLSLGTIGIPALHISNLENGIFKQQLTPEVKRSAAINLNLYKQTDYDHDLDSEMTLTADDIKEQEIGLLGLSL